MGIAALGLAGTAIGGITSFIGTQQTASANAAAANYQAQVARNNAIIARQNADYASAAGAAKAQAQDFKNRAAQAELLTAQAASGIDIASPSSTDIRSSQADIGRLDTETIYSNAQQTVRSEEQKSQNYTSAAGLYESQAANAKTAGLISGFGSLVGTATSFGDKWLRYQNVGMPGYGSI